MNTCPCCSSPLLRYISDHEVYWFCRHCWQAMPVLSEKKISLLPQLVKLDKILHKPDKLNGYVSPKSFVSKVDTRLHRVVEDLNLAKILT